MMKGWCDKGEEGVKMVCESCEVDDGISVEKGVCRDH